MRKLITPSILILVLLASIVLAGCQSGKYRACLFSELNGAQTSSSASLGVSTKSFKSATAPETMKVSFDGKDYTGTYRRSWQYAGNGNAADEYVVDPYEPNGVSYFQVDSGTHNLLFVDYANKDFSERDLQKPVRTVDEVKAAAIRWASEFISVDDYSFTREDIRKGNETTPNVYDYRLCSMVQGIETTDYVDILITDRGTLVNIGAAQPGWTKEHQAELRAFSVEAATNQAKSASGIFLPKVTDRRFGITSDGVPYLMVFLSGSKEESVIMAVVAE